MSIITVTGPSGVGKSTLVANLLATGPGFRMVRSVTPSRESRPGDNPDEYLKVTEEQFASMAIDGQFLWVTDVIHGNLFATERDEVVRALESPEKYLMIISVAHAPILTGFAMETEDLVIPVFLMSPGEVELHRRISERPGSTPEDTDRRLAECANWESTARTQSIPRYHFVDTRGTPASVCSAVLRLIAEKFPS